MFTFLTVNVPDLDVNYIMYVLDLVNIFKKPWLLSG